MGLNVTHLRKASNWTALAFTISLPSLYPYISTRSDNFCLQPILARSFYFLHSRKKKHWLSNKVKRHEGYKSLPSSHNPLSSTSFAAMETPTKLPPSSPSSPTTGFSVPSAEKVDGFPRRSMRRARQRRSHSSSQFRYQSSQVELTPLPLLKGKFL